MKSDVPFVAPTLQEFVDADITAIARRNALRSAIAQQVAKYVAAHRTTSRLTQTALAERIGVSRQTSRAGTCSGRSKVQVGNPGSRGSGVSLPRVGPALLEQPAGLRSYPVTDPRRDRLAEGRP